MQRQPSWNTKPEIAVRCALHRLGLRYAIHTRPLRLLRREADVVFRRARVAIFVNGCFWHGCDEHRPRPKANAGWWRRKLARTRARDVETDIVLRRHGWLPVRIWEHEIESGLDTIARRILRNVRRRLDVEA